tara:strand:+ start:126 stop:3101 length:2976 start_codon:yes stop_codon:yes gene_type:complete
MEKVYIVKTYKNCFKNEEGDYKLENMVITNENINDLRFDKGYHYKIEPERKCSVFGDIDKALSFTDLCNAITSIRNLYNVSKEEIIHSYSDKIENGKLYYGAHWVIPTIKSNIKSIKKQLTPLNSKLGNIIDLSVYKSGLFRLPYQTVDEKKNVHTIQQGNGWRDLKYFLVHDTKYCTSEQFEINIEVCEKKIDTSDIITHNKLDYNLLDALSDEFHTGYTNWRNMSFFMKNLNYTYDDFLRLSRGKSFSSEKSCLSMWNSTGIKAGLTESYFYSRLKQTKPDVFASMKCPIKFTNTKFVDETQIINISQRYLISLNNEKLDDESDVLTSNINKFFSCSDIKSFSIKSPYDTGKTKLLTHIFKKYEPKRILWISYRKTLTNDILGSFSEQFGFKDYQRKEYSANRLIIQLESLVKLKPSMMFVDDEYEIPKYDLIIIDEIESVLSHFDSPTFKGQSREVFNWMTEIIKVSSKIILLDGDIGNRTYNFLNYFGTSINIINDIKINKRNITITNDLSTFDNQIITDISKSRKIVICSMSSKKCSEIYDKIKLQFPKKKVLIYTGKTDDKNKLDLLDVKASWTTSDVVIYSPTIEAGVNFDSDYFYKIYGIICTHSTSQRAFMQMLSRVRKIQSSDILLLNVNSSLSVNTINDQNRYYYDEIKENLISLDIVKINEVINNGKIKKELELYDSNYVFNKIENLYKHDFYFLGYLKLLVDSKGHNITFLNDKKKQDILNIEGDDIVDDNLLTTLDINKLEYDFLKQKQLDNWATAEDKLKISRYVYKMCLGIDYLNCDDLGRSIVKHYDFNTLKKYSGLISPNNISISSDNLYKEEVKKVEIITKLISEMGFKNMYDRSTKINSDEFKDRIKLLKLFTDDKAMRVLFKTKSIKSSFDSIKGFLGCINTIMLPYSIKISSKRKKLNQKEIYIYQLENITGRDHIDELLQFRINKGYDIETDIRQITINNIYKELIKVKPIVINSEDETIYKIKTHTM